jgi:hypothetical protein
MFGSSFEIGWTTMIKHLQGEATLVPQQAGGGSEAGTDGGDREVQLAVMVPTVVKAAVRRRAHEEGVTVRALLLRLIREAGIANVDESDLTDRRVAAAALKSRLYREALGRP